MYPSDRDFRPARHLVIEEEPVPLTNADDDSDYVADPGITDVEFLRCEAAHQSAGDNPEVGARLSDIADRLDELEMKALSYDHAHVDAVEMGYPSLTEALEHLEELRELRAADSDFRGRGQTARRPPTGNVIGATEYPLELTQEMQLPPDFKPSPLRLWEVENNRDLVAELRGEIKNAHLHGHDILSNRSNHQVMCDLKECTGDYLDVPEDAMVEAIAYVREHYGKK